jgi:hypothetical protein
MMSSIRVSLKGFAQFASTALMLVFLNNYIIEGYKIVDPARINQSGMERVLSNHNPNLAPYCTYQGHKAIGGSGGCGFIDIYYCGW